MDPATNPALPGVLDLVAGGLVTGVFVVCWSNGYHVIDGRRCARSPNPIAIAQSVRFLRAKRPKIAAVHKIAMHRVSSVVLWA